jgi:carbon monoxide dehydrogenase subunit G
MYGGAIDGPREDDAAAYEAGDVEKAYDLWRPAAQEDARAKIDPAPRYGEGPGVANDDAQAVKRDRLAANPGDGMAEEIKVSATRAADGKTLQVVVALALQVNPDVVWAVLNDYKNMPRFVPDILAVRLISAGSGRKRVEIESVARLLVLEFPINTTLDVVSRPDGSIAIDSVAGNMAIHGVVRLHSDGSTTRVDYQVRMAPDFWLPPLIGDFLIGRQIKRQFEGMVAEMRRRAGSRQMETRPIPVLLGLNRRSGQARMDAKGAPRRWR